MKKLVLFDIDGTLMYVGDSHKKSFVFALKKILNIDYNKDDLKKFSGYTDLQIIHEIMDNHGIEKDPEKIAGIINAMIDEFGKANLGHSVLLGGIPELLDSLSQKKDIILGLVTGNVEEIAYTKLSHFKIKDYFALGGFGNISPIRADLVEAAVKQAEKDEKIEKSNVFIIGDTIHDIAAAKKARVKVIATATGPYSYEQLEEESPNYLFHDLEDTEKIVNVICNE